MWNTPFLRLNTRKHTWLVCCLRNTDLSWHQWSFVKPPLLSQSAIKIHRNQVFHRIKYQRAHNSNFSESHYLPPLCLTISFLESRLGRAYLHNITGLIYIHNFSSYSNLVRWWQVPKMLFGTQFMIQFSRFTKPLTYW